jgi:hypothetical protein
MQRHRATGRGATARRLAVHLLADESAVTAMECVVAGTSLGVVAVAAYRLLAVVLASLAYRVYLIATLLTS